MKSSSALAVLGGWEEGGGEGESAKLNQKGVIYCVVRFTDVRRATWIARSCHRRTVHVRLSMFLYVVISWIDHRVITR